MKKTIKIACNITGTERVFKINQIEKKYAEYGGEDNFKRFYVCQGVTQLIKRGVSMSQICSQMNVEYEESKKDYYNELIAFIMQMLNDVDNTVKSSETTQMETDPAVKQYIDLWVSSL